ncbi:hypothetical protein NUSPORA_02540 [Nucleospora cyclopteri]
MKHLFWRKIVKLEAQALMMDQSLKLSKDTKDAFKHIKNLHTKLVKFINSQITSKVSTSIKLKESKLNNKKNKRNGKETEKDHLNKDTIQKLDILLEFYLESEKMILYLINEMFRKGFYESVDNKMNIFILLNKIMKIFVNIDQMILTTDIFSKYTMYKSSFNYENERLTILSCITLPMGRMILTLFCDSKNDLFHPNKLSKRTKVFLTDQKKKYLMLYQEISKIQELKYLQLYLGVICEFFIGEGFLKPDELEKGLLDYGKLLKHHE